MNSGTSSTELNDMFTDFVNYVDSFYGQNDPLYPMMSQETKQPLTKFDILRATENYLSMCSDKTNKSCEWGDGDSLDRERVRDILLYDYNYKFVGEQMRVTNHINKSKMKVKELIEALSYYDGDDNITFYFLKNDTLTNCQVEDIAFYSDTMGVEFTIQDTSEVMEEVDV